MFSSKAISTDSQSLQFCGDIILIEDHVENDSLLSRALGDFNYRIVKHLSHCNNLHNIVQQSPANFIVIGVEIPSEETFTQLALLHDLSPMPVVIFSEKHTTEAIQNAVKAGVTAFIVDDIQPKRFKSIFAVAQARFAQAQAQRKELNQVKERLEARKLLEKAKGLLMLQKHLSEDDAYKAIRKMAMDKGQTLSVVSRNLIDVLDFLAIH